VPDGRRLPRALLVLIHTVIARTSDSRSESSNSSPRPPLPLVDYCSFRPASLTTLP
jgi:hypothetical protein